MLSGDIGATIWTLWDTLNTFRGQKRLGTLEEIKQHIFYAKKIKKNDFLNNFRSANRNPGATLN